MRVSRTNMHAHTHMCMEVGRANRANVIRLKRVLFGFFLLKWVGGHGRPESYIRTKLQCFPYGKNLRFFRNKSNSQNVKFYILQNRDNVVHRISREQSIMEDSAFDDLTSTVLS